MSALCSVLTMIPSHGCCALLELLSMRIFTATPSVCVKAAPGVKLLPLPLAPPLLLPGAGRLIKSCTSMLSTWPAP
jgi:hypothetical protein